MPTPIQSGSGNLSNNTATFTFSGEQKNNITLSTSNKFIDSNITLTTKVTKAILNTTSDDTDHKTFSIQIPNGNSNPVLLTFTTNTTGNTVVTGTNVTT